MISNHNRATSSFRIIEPKHHQMTSYQHAQQMPINLPHQIPILTINNNNQKTNHLVNSNSATNLMYHQQQQQQQHFQQQQLQQQRIRNLSDTDSSYIPGKLNSISNIYTRLSNIYFAYNTLFLTCHF